MANLKDSGERRKFDTGAVRDIQEGKGRCDLLPLDVVAKLLQQNKKEDEFLFNVELFKTTGDECFLYDAVKFALVEVGFTSVAHATLEVSIHFEDGAKKYGENNWQKGIPVKAYLDSAVRHYLKYLDCMTDEPHNRAVIWNLMCAIWTCENKPELNQYLKGNGE